MEAFVSLIALLGMGGAAYVGIKWMLRNGQMNAHKEQPLTPRDLKILEESAARLMSDLRAVTDECVARIENACAGAQCRMQAPEMCHPAKVMDLSRVNNSGPAAAPIAHDLPDSTLTAAQIAKQAGMTTGEVELLRGLECISTR